MQDRKMTDQIWVLSMSSITLMKNIAILLKRQIVVMQQD